VTVPNVPIGPTKPTAPSKPTVPSWAVGLEPKIRDQAVYIVDKFNENGAADAMGEGHWKNANGGIDIGVATLGAGVGFMYAEGQILVLERYLERVQDILGEPKPTVRAIAGTPAGTAAVEPVIDGVVILHLSKDRAALDALDRVDRVLGPGYATPNHVITVAGDGGPCPATDPEEVYDGTEPYPAVSPGGGGAGISIYVADTGLLWYQGDQLDVQAATPLHPHQHEVVTNEGSPHPWLRGVRGTLDKLEDIPNAQANQPQTVLPYEGHGTFVAGVVRCMAPRSEIYVANAFKVAGSTLETHLARHLDAALAHGYDLFHLSITSPTRKDLPLITVEGWLRRLRSYKGVACVVAAGNSGYSLPTWPAAFPDVVSVGALAADWRSRASFSNHGPWVDVYAPGRNLVNAFAIGNYQCYMAPYTGQPRTFYGMAKWSGTSFSTPIVTGLIAARMSRTGENGKEAAASLLAEARERAVPGVGPIALPYYHDRAWPVR
jgi:subtilisin family serine protease